MSQTVYTNYWINRRDNVRKKHGSYLTEEEAINGIRSWWELHKDNYTDVNQRRTNSDALEITYGEDNYYYRVEKNEIDHALPSPNPKKRPKGEIDRLRQKYDLNGELFFYEELAEPYQDRLKIVMNDGAILSDYTFDIKGRPVKKLSEY